jgi:hypothetical protein
LLCQGAASLKTDEGRALDLSRSATSLGGCRKASDDALFLLGVVVVITRIHEKAPPASMGATASFTRLADLLRSLPGERFARAAWFQKYF